MALTKSEIIELYTATFNRAADADGVAYWLTQTQLNQTEMANAFLASTEAAALYPTTQTTTEYVEAIYNNLFGHAADADGLAYWIAQLDGGTVAKESMVVAVVNGALGTDQTIVDNRTAVSTKYVDGNSNATDVSLASVTADAATLTAAEATADTAVTAIADAATAAAQAAADAAAAAAAVGQIVTLTTKIDALSGTAGDDTFVGDNSTASAADQVAGGAGNDTYKLYTTGAVTLPVASSVENYYVKGANVAINVASQTDMTSLELDNYTTASATADVTLASGQSLKVSNTATATGNIDIAGAASITSLDIETSASGSTAAITYDIQATGVKTVNLTSSGNGTAAQNNTVTVAETGANLTTVSLAGSQDATVTATASAATLTSFDASTATGNMTVNLGNNTTATGAVSIKGGAGNDTITATGAVNYTVDMGAGNDRLITADAAGELTALDSIDGGAGSDTLEMLNAEAINLDAGTTATKAILAKVSNFETLAITDAITTAGALNIGALGFNNLTLVSDTIAGDATVTGFTSGATITNEALTMAGNTLTYVDTSGNATVYTAVVNNNTYSITGVGTAATDAASMAAAINAGEGTGTVSVAAAVITGVTGYISAETVDAGTNGSSTVVLNDGIDNIVSMTGATAAGTNDDVLNIALNGNLTANDILESSYGIAGINKINIAANDANNADAATNATDGYVIGLMNDASVDTITVTGSSFLSYTESTTATSLSTIDASASTGNMIINAVAHAGTQGVVINGSAGTNTLSGSNLADNITGGAKADTIDGNVGADVLTGGGAIDTFVFAANDIATASATNMKHIADFNTGGSDVIQVSGATFQAATSATATAGTAAVDANGFATFHVADDTLAEQITAASGAASATDDYVVWENGGNSYVFIDGSNGGGAVNAADILIELTGVTGLTTTNDGGNSASLTLG